LIAFRILSKDLAAEVFSYMNKEDIHYIIEAINDDELRIIMDRIFLDDTKTLFLFLGWGGCLSNRLALRILRHGCR
ncbi:MAG: hypothetical protein HUK15_08220, partial [Bacteroidales bacterium]|nr:hypothetical protein [Bacteroidales bacterium]